MFHIFINKNKTQETIANHLQNFSLEGTKLRIDNAVPWNEPFGQDSENIFLKIRIEDLAKLLVKMTVRLIQLK